MLEKFLVIQNVSKFENYKPIGDVSLAPITLIYGENGRGKSTLAAILRSISNQDANPILERKTVGSTNETFVQLLIEAKVFTFNENKHWNATYPYFEIFDSTFINANIYSGEVVNIEHRRRLYHYVVGEDGVNLAKNVEKLTAEIKRTKSRIQKKALEIEEKIAYRGTIEDFIKLPQVDNVNERLAEAEKNLERIKSIDEIQRIKTLSNLTQPDFSIQAIQQTLQKQIQDISNTAEERTKEHIAKCMDNSGEKWIEQGLFYVKDDECPFCGQKLDGLELIQAYRGYFDAEYKSLKEAIRKDIRTVKTVFSQDALLEAQKIFDNNEALFETWRLKTSLSDVDWVFADYVQMWNQFRNQLINLLDTKANTPLDDVIASQDIEQVTILWEQIGKYVSEYNQWVQQVNQEIEQFKRTIQKGNLQEAREKVEHLRAVQQRFSGNVPILCEEYTDLVAERELLEKKKEQTKGALDEYVDKVFTQYVTSINNYLEKFGTNFRIGAIKTSYQGGNPSTSYGLLLNDIPVKVGTSKSEGKPNFRSGTSDGDKRSLALAFFLSKIENDKNIKDKIIVFDDPITSLDQNRRSSTKDEIIKVAKSAKQVIILSHDMNFLRECWDNVQKSKTLSIERKGRESVIKAWDIATATQSNYFKSYFSLIEYTDKSIGRPLDVVRCIRPVMEGYLRTRFPREFDANEWLGQFIEKIENADTLDPLARIKDLLPEIVAINDYSKKYHHQQNPNADNEPVNDAELVTYINRVLNLLDK